MASGQTASQTSSSTGSPYDGPSSGRRRDVHIAGSASGKIVSDKASDTRAGGKTGDNGGGGVRGGDSGDGGSRDKQGLTSRLRATRILGAARRMVEIYSAVVENCRLFGGTGSRMTDPGGWFILAGA